VADTDAAAEDARGALATVGLDDVRGWWAADDALAAVAAAGRAPGRVPRLTTAALADLMAGGRARVLDVRGAAEWEAGRLPDAAHIPLGQLEARLDEARALAAGGALAVHCQGGLRSAMAASVLAAHGVPATDVPAGYAGWAREGRPVRAG
jgi:hydroxyacylglutathione hydrolase